MLKNDELYNKSNVVIVSCYAILAQGAIFFHFSKDCIVLNCVYVS